LEGRLGGPPPGGQPLPRPARLHRRRRRAPVGALRRLRHERRHRRRAQPLVAAGRVGVEHGRVGPALHLRGWADPAMLDAYEAERQPITEQVSRFAMDHAQKMIKARSAVPPNLEADDAAGAAARARIGEEAYQLNVQQFCCAGLNYGYYYTGSPIIAPDAEAPPAYTMGGFTPSTTPGRRAPHFWLGDGRSLYDAFGAGYTLLRTQADVDVQPLLAAAAAAGLPLQLLDIGAEAQRPPEYRHALLLCRPDQHVVWRGERVPGDAAALVR